MASVAVEVSPARRSPSFSLAFSLALASVIALVLLVGKLAPWVAHKPGVESAADALPAPEQRLAYLKARYLLDATNPAKAGAQASWQRAAALFEEVARVEPDFTPALVGWSRALRHTGQLDDAARIASRAVALDPESHEALHVLGSVAIEQGDLDRASDLLNRARILAPSDANLLLTSAFLATLREDAQQALTLARRAMLEDPLSAMLMGDAGYFFLWAGEHREAANICREALDLEPDFWPARSCALRALEAAGDPRAASEHALAVMRSAGSTEATLRALEQDDPEHALEVYRQWRIARLEPRLPDPDVAYALSLLHARQGNLENALEELSKAGKQNPSVLRMARMEPELEPLHSDERFHALLARPSG